MPARKHTLTLTPTPADSGRSKVLLSSRRKDHTRGTGKQEHFNYLWTAAIEVQGEKYAVTTEDGANAALALLIHELAEALDAEQDTVSWLLKQRVEQTA